MKDVDNKIIMLDTSALLTYLENEKGVEIVENFFEMAEAGQIRIYVSFITLTERNRDVCRMQIF